MQKYMYVQKSCKKIFLSNHDLLRNWKIFLPCINFGEKIEVLGIKGFSQKIEHRGMKFENLKTKALEFFFFLSVKKEGRHHQSKILFPSISHKENDFYARTVSESDNFNSAGGTRSCFSDTQLQKRKKAQLQNHAV